MKIELVVQNSQTGEILDISEVVSGISWDTFLVDNSGRLTFDHTQTESLIFPKGSIVWLKVDGKGVFFGYYFKSSKSPEADKRSVVCYDQLRYLKNKDTYVVIDKTLAEQFSTMCKDFKLKYKILDNPTYKLPPKIHDDENLFNIIKYGIDMTLINAQQWYTVYDDFGYLTLSTLDRLKTDLIVSEGANLVSYKVSGSIDEDTYNQIKITQENKETAKRDVYVVKDSKTVAQWGILQHYLKVDENSNAAQIEALGTKLLALKNREMKKLSLTVLGDLKVQAGFGIILDIKALDQEGINQLQYYIVESCSHKFDNNEHTMQLEVRLSA